VLILLFVQGTIGISFEYFIEEIGNTTSNPHDLIKNVYQPLRVQRFRESMIFIEDLGFEEHGDEHPWDNCC
jgi:hypothetical protein